MNFIHVSIKTIWRAGAQKSDAKKYETEDTTMYIPTITTLYYYY